MLVLREQFELSPTEQRALWLLIGFDIDPRIRRLVHQVAGDTIRATTVGTLLSVIYDDVSDAGIVELGLNGRLVECALAEVEGADIEGPLSQRRIRVADRVLELATGVVRVDPAIRRFVQVAEPGRDLTELEIDPAATNRAVIAVREAESLVLVCGRAGCGRRTLLVAAAKQRGSEVLEIDGRGVATQVEGARRQLRIVARECRLLGVVPLFRHLDALGDSGDIPDRFAIVDEMFAGLILATSAKPITRQWRRAPVIVELPALSGLQNAKLWSRALPEASGGDADVLATMYPLAPALIHAAGVAASRHRGEGKMTAEHIEAGIRTVLDDRLAGLATRITVTQKWDDLVLPDDQMTTIVELLARIRERRKVYEDWGFANKVGKGLGVSALFTGPPGTGKTMAAGLIARGLGVELYQVDLSKITSKWIGETEKNLAALFDAAEAGHAILLFDEADALFGKRTDVKSSNDRHANQEVNYLLQRMESFTGICVLTSNHESSIDEAFRRRLSVHVRFPVPETKERRRLWRALLPQAAPIVGELPFDHLAETFVMSGGYIRNAILRAAFLAADQGDTLGAAHLVHAAQLEYESMGKIVASVGS
jgi:hypothetical protein